MDYLEDKHVARSSKGGAQSAQQTHCKRGPPKRTDEVIMEQFSEMEYWAAAIVDMLQSCQGRSFKAKLLQMSVGKKDRFCTDVAEKETQNLFHGALKLSNSSPRGFSQEARWVQGGPGAFQEGFQGRENRNKHRRDKNVWGVERRPTILIENLAWCLEIGAIYLQHTRVHVPLLSARARICGQTLKHSSQSKKRHQIGLNI